MTRAWMTGLACVGVLLTAGPLRAETATVFLLGGQSNMLGRAPASGLPTSPVDLQAPQTDVLLLNGNGGASGLLNTLVPLQPGSGTDFGPEITFGRDMADANSAATFALIKWAEGGTSLASDWNPSVGTAYASFRSTVSAGLAALDGAGYETEIAGMLWMQGERDARSATDTANYEANLTAFIADIRGRYGAELPFLIGETFKNEYGEGISAAQAAVAAADPLTKFVSTRSMSFQSDNLHLDASGQQELGYAFAAAYLGTDGNDPGPDPDPGSGAIARWDIDSDNSGGWITQEGFASVPASGNSDNVKPPLVVTDNGVTLTMAGTWKLDNDRAPGSYPAVAGQELESMLRDFVTAPDSLFGSLAFELTGLEADTDYTVRAWSYDARDTYDGRIIDWRDGENAILGSITLDHADPENAYADLAVTSGPDGTLTIVADGRGFNFWVNGIELLPEPTALSLLLVPAAVLLLRRRR